MDRLKQLTATSSYYKSGNLLVLLERGQVVWFGPITPLNRPEAEAKFQQWMAKGWLAATTKGEANEHVL